MHGDEIGFLYNLVKGAYSHAHVLAAFLVDIWVVADDFHIKGQGALCHAAADTAHADNAQGFALQLNACVLLAVPLALLEGFIGNRYMARHSHHHGTGMLGGSNGVAARGVDNNNALVGSGSDIDVVYAHTGTADNLQILGSRNNLGCNLGGGAHNQRIVIRDNSQKLIGWQLVPYIALKLILQNVYSHLGNAICN